ncbi:MAG: excisionase family DNA-binding protein [Myxococcales bacterium]|nr:excisionase family DNA-binding protein [Myxococcales bacterium]
MSQLITRTKAAEKLAVSIATLDRLIAAGTLPAIRLRRRVLILESDVTLLIFKRRAELAALTTTTTN